jgi:hypothetical protein
VFSIAMTFLYSNDYLVAFFLLTISVTLAGQATFFTTIFLVIDDLTGS